MGPPGVEKTHSLNVNPAPILLCPQPLVFGGLGLFINSQQLPLGAEWVKRPGLHSPALGSLGLFFSDGSVSLFPQQRMPRPP